MYSRTLSSIDVIGDFTIYTANILPIFYSGCGVYKQSFVLNRPVLVDGPKTDRGAALGRTRLLFRNIRRRRPGMRAAVNAATNAFGDRAGDARTKCDPAARVSNVRYYSDRNYGPFRLAPPPDPHPPPKHLARPGTARPPPPPGS